MADIRPPVMADPVTIGRRDGLQMEITWSQPEGATVDALTEGRLRVLVAGQPVWFGRDEGVGVNWPWIDLAEHLANFWGRLQIEEAYPLELEPVFPSELWKVAERRWDSGPADKAEEEASKVESFSAVHDLSRALPGIEMPPLWVMKEGASAWVDWSPRYRAGQSARLLPFSAVFVTFERFVDQVLKRVENLADPRVEAFRETWQNRKTALSNEEVEQIVTGLSRPYLIRLKRISKEKSGEELFRGPEAATFLAAARMTGTVVLPNVVGDILGRIKAVGPAKNTEGLDAISSLASIELGKTHAHKPYEQGYRLATWLRSQQGIVEGGYVDAERLLTKWGVPTGPIDLGADSEEISAIAVWSKQHGPYVFVNTTGRRSAGNGGRNFTLAHEVCHLLVDRQSSLPLVEVFGGRLPAGPEQRANAFAAELLLPREFAKRVLGSGEDLPNRAKSLAQQYRVSYELVAWQIRNYPGIILDPAEEAYLKSLVHDQANF